MSALPCAAYPATSTARQRPSRRTSRAMRPRPRSCRRRPQTAARARGPRRSPAFRAPPQSCRGARAARRQRGVEGARPARAARPCFRAAPRSAPRALAMPWPRHLHRRALRRCRLCRHRRPRSHPWPRHTSASWARYGALRARHGRAVTSAAARERGTACAPPRWAPGARRVRARRPGRSAGSSEPRSRAGRQ